MNSDGSERNNFLSSKKPLRSPRLCEKKSAPFCLRDLRNLREILFSKTNPPLPLQKGDTLRKNVLLSAKKPLRSPRFSEKKSAPFCLRDLRNLREILFSKTNPLLPLQRGTRFGKTFCYPRKSLCVLRTSAKKNLRLFVCVICEICEKFC